MIEQSLLTALTNRERMLVRAVVVEVLTDHTYIVELQQSDDELYLLADLVTASRRPSGYSAVTQCSVGSMLRRRTEG